MNRLRSFSSLSSFLAILGLILIFFHKMAFSNLILARGDTFLYFYPYWQMAAAALRNGRIPLWNPHLFMGAPFLANSQVGFFYPLNWPLWLLWRTPYAVSASILLHLFIAGVGAYLAGRRCLSLGRTAGLVTAVLFCLSGYLTAQVEHINQLQGLAWLPWFFVVVHHVSFQNKPSWRTIGQGGLAIAALFGLQVLAGHTQTTFITAVALLLWLAGQIVETRNWKLSISNLQSPIASLLFGGLLALLLTAVQLLPTLELASQSARQSGLTVNEVLSFSLHPLLLTQALLPRLGQSLFSEYVAFIPLTMLMLAVLGAWQWRQVRGVLPALMLVGIGLLLALGAFNPMNWLLARLPGFNLFRVPARWLILYSFGISLLAGLGWQIALDRWLVFTRSWNDVPQRARAHLWVIDKPLQVAFFVASGLIIWGMLARYLTIFVPTGAEAPFEPINNGSTAVWLIELLITYLILTGQRPAFNPEARLRFGWQRTRLGSPYILAGMSLLILFVASRSQPYNNLTTPEAYFDLRPSTTRLMAGAADRFLSLSNIFFDPGDQAEIDTIYADQLSLAAQYDYTIAIKQKEIVAPNLSMTYGLSSIDGFDGGILPLDSYSQLMSLVLPEGDVTTDGRLREHLAAVPEARWLDLFNGRYLITDKVGDTWQDGVFFDMQHPVDLVDDVTVGYVPNFEAAEIWLLADGQPGDIMVTTAVSQSQTLTPQLITDTLYKATLPQPTTLQTITLSPPFPRPLAPPLLYALSLVNNQNNTFQSLVSGQYRLIHSGDVKIYENLDVLPRAFVVHDWQWQPDVAGSLDMMRDEAFVVGQTAVLVGNGTAVTNNLRPSAQIEWQQDEPERIALHVNNPAPGQLVLTDAFYPGWQVTIDGEAQPIYQVDVLFRGVMVGGGEHDVVFEFVSRSWRNGRLLTLIGLITTAILAFIIWRTGIKKG